MRATRPEAGRPEAVDVMSTVSGAPLQLNGQCQEIASELHEKAVDTVQRGNPLPPIGEGFVDAIAVPLDWRE